MKRLDLKHVLASDRSAPPRLQLVALVALVVATTITLSACNQQADHKAQTAAAARLIVTTPDSPDSLMTDIPKFIQWEQDFLLPNDSTKKWEFRHLTAAVTTEGSSPETRLVVDGPKPSMITRAKFQASEIAFLDLDGTALPESARIFWAKPGEPFDQANFVSATQIQQGRSLRFGVNSHPDWSGAVGRLRIEFEAERGSTYSLHSIRAVDMNFTPEYLADLSSRPFIVEVDGTAIPSRFLIPGAPLEWRLQAQPGDRLHFSIVTPASSAGISRLRINLTTRETGTSEIYSFTLKGRNSTAWVEHDINLPVSEDSEITLQFEIEATKSNQEGPACAVLGNPRVLRKQPKKSHPNLILISVDTLRADHLSSYGYEQKTTPMLDAFFEENGTIFNNVVAGAPWTLPSHVTMFSGLDSTNHGANFDEIPEPSTVDFLAETLRFHGYTSAAWTGGGYLSPNFGFAAGFDRYSSWPTAHSDNELLVQAERAKDWIINHRDERFFVMLHTYEVHTPFRPREPYFSEFRGDKPSFGGVADTETLTASPEDGFLNKNAFVLIGNDGQPSNQAADPELLNDLYDSGIAYSDSILGKFLRNLEESGLLANTLIVITSDHGESFGEKELFGHGNLHDSNLMVPLLVAGPGIKSSGYRIEDQVRLVDLAPTLLDLMGIEPSKNLDGVSLVPLLKGETRQNAEIAWSYSPKTNFGMAARVGNREKLIFNNAAWALTYDHTEYFDLVRDPAELNDLGGQANPKLKRLTKNTVNASPYGLELSISNQTKNQIGAVFAFERSDYLLVFKVKGQELPPSSVKVGPGRAFTVTLKAGASADLVLESIKTRNLSIVGSGQSVMEKSLNHLIDLPGMSTETTLYFDGSGWIQTSQPQNDPPVSIRLAWKSEKPSDSRPTTINEDLRKQLEALGYVE